MKRKLNQICKMNKDIETNLIIFIYCLFKNAKLTIDAKYLEDEEIQKEAIDRYLNDPIFYNIYNTLKHSFFNLYEELNK